jgi:hypothetical protein
MLYKMEESVINQALMSSVYKHPQYDVPKTKEICSAKSVIVMPLPE